jgi:hypothetical protein
MPMIHVETVKAVQELLRDRGIEQRPDESWGDYVARGLGVSGAKAQAFLDALHRGCSVGEAQLVAGIRDRGALVQMARKVGRMLGKIRRQASVVPPLRSRWHPKMSGIGATEDQVNVTAQVPQRIDRRGTKVEDLAGVGAHDAQGG